MLCHLTALSLFIGVPFGHLLGPLVIWLIRRREDAFAEIQGKESLNFQISMTLYAIIAAVLSLLVVGFILLGLLVLFDIALVILASIKTSRGEMFAYPITLRLIR